MMHLGGRGLWFIIVLVNLGLALAIACLITYIRIFIVPPPVLMLLGNSSMHCHRTHDAQVLTEQDLKADVGPRLPSLPLAYWQQDKHFWKTNETCPKFPSIEDIIFENTYWQTLRTTHGTFHLYGAYLDTRKALSNKTAVRIIGVHDSKDPVLTMYCQLWFQERKKPVIVHIHRYMPLWLKNFDFQKNSTFRPYLMSCVLPEDVCRLVPVSVSLVDKSCRRATNNLRVRHERPSVKKKNFVVCVKALDFLHKDMSVRFVEWIEFVRLMGADKIFFYKLRVHPNISKVLDYYSAIGLVTISPFTFPASQILNLPGLRQLYVKKGNFKDSTMNSVPYNDCLYRNLYKYRWVVLLDIDEIIVPFQDYNWGTVLQRVLALSKPMPDDPLVSSYAATHTYFLEGNSTQQDLQINMPSYMYMLQQIYRLRNHTDPKCCTKAFHDIERVLTLHDNFPIECVGGNCSAYWLNETHARLHRYRKDTGALDSKYNSSCERVKHDTLVWRWRKPLIKRVASVLRSLNLI